MRENLRYLKFLYTLRFSFVYMCEIVAEGILSKLLSSQLSQAMQDKSASNEKK